MSETAESRGEARLFVLSGPDVARSFPLGEKTVLGRSDECDVVLRDRSISRKHAVLERAGDAWTLQDLGSTNGISKDGKRAERIELADGDEFKLGDLPLRVKRDAAVGADIEFHFGPPPPTAATPAAAPPRAAPSPKVVPPAAAQADEIEIEEEIEIEGPDQPTRPPGSLASPAPRPPRAERRTGFFAADLEQSPLWMRFALFLVVLAAGAGIAWGAFRVVHMLRSGLG